MECKHIAKELFPPKDHEEDRGDLRESTVHPKSFVVKFKKKIIRCIIKEEQVAVCFVDVQTLYCPFFLNIADTVNAQHL